MELQNLVPIATLVLGWGLAEISARLRGRRRVRIAVGRAVADLLDIRFNLLAVGHTIAELKNRFPIPDDALPPLRTILSQAMAPPEGLHDRYDAAVSRIAGTDPVLAYSMRSSTEVMELLSGIRSLASGDPQARRALEHLEPELLAAASDRLRDKILSAARLHGRVTEWRVRRVLRRQSRIPAEAGGLVERLAKHVAM